MIRITITGPEEVIKLEKLSRSGNDRVARRAMMILHANDGIPVPKIARLLHCSPITVRRHLHRYNKFGIEGLYDKPCPGRPRKFTEEHLQVLQEIMTKSPQDFGYVQTVWTLKLVRQHLKDELKITVSKATLRRALKKLGFHWGRPRHTVVKEDPEAKSKLEAIRNTLYEFADRKRSIDFIHYLESVEERHPKGRIYVILDNGPSHTSKITKDWLAKHERIKLLYLPNYSPQLSPIEKLWEIIKGWVSAN